ncbi:MAG: crosslink repair DNA glycosylase YcaQ family protein [Candidatus Dormibacteria bacterium]
MEKAMWGTPVQTFEYWAHAACVLPLSLWPWFAAERRRRRAHAQASRSVSEDAVREVRTRLAGEGPQTVAQLGGGRLSEGWWNWSPIKVAVEELYNLGEVVCVERQAWRRVYDLAERVIPAPLRNQEPSDDACHVRLVTIAMNGLGLASERDLQHYFTLSREAVRAGIAGAELTPVRVAGWKDPAWASGWAVNELNTPVSRGRARTTLLSPFDSLLWDRDRVLRIFGFRHKLEAYFPEAKRIHGYYAMPLLAGGMLRGRVDPKREGRTLVARQVSVEPGAEAAMASALAETASWVACDSVVVSRLEPEGSRGALESGLRALGLD